MKHDTNMTQTLMNLNCLTVVCVASCYG